VHLRAIGHYRGKLRGRFDVVIDQVNTIPFFTPLWADVPIFMMVWQLAREVWWYESRFPLSGIVYILEPVYLRAYRNTPVLTYSNSTKTDLRHLGFRAPISVLPVGIEPVGANTTAKSTDPTFVYVGRLAPSKRVDDIIHAFAIFHHRTSRGRLLLIGQGPDRYVAHLRHRSVDLGVSDRIDFCGWLTGEEKHRQMTRAWVLLMASVREGWGLVVTEANACGTPAVVYDVAGLRDSVRHEQTGLVVAPTPRALADGMERLVRAPELYSQFRQSALNWSHAFTFEAGARLVQEKIGDLIAI